MSHGHGDGEAGGAANAVLEILLNPGGTVTAHSHQSTLLVAPRSGLLAVTNTVIVRMYVVR